MNLTPVALMEGTYFAVSVPSGLIPPFIVFFWVFVCVGQLLMVDWSYSYVDLVCLIYSCIRYMQNTVFGGKPSKPDHSNIPCAVFWYDFISPSLLLNVTFFCFWWLNISLIFLFCSIPPLSVVGLSEEQAIEQAKGDLLVFTSTFTPMKNTISGYV